MTPPTTPKSRRRWLQFSLRTLLFGLLLACCFLGWVASKIEQARKQNRAAEAITKLGGSANSWTEPPISSWRRKLLGEHLGRDVVKVDLNGSEITDADLVSLRDLYGLRFLSLTGTGLTNAGLEHLIGLPELLQLSLADTRVTDAGLPRLKSLSRLELLKLDRTWITDSGVEHLCGFAQLRALSLIDTQITDASLPRLKSLPRLEYLHLNGTKVTDAGMECLGGFTQLRVLSLANTQVMDAGIMELQQFLPNTRIVR